ncbi:S66 peptidase family protein [Desulfoluna spongiiphila]|uniref:S66 peptidase family protein n=1 Tax=Desulfoluna spongiiphila TaxID=419481 RepID=UPI00125C964F|nr:LD-carboxypeptidase [Desulfoluna spongiiphila]VVS93364.1 peptidase family s66 [Desulfoluna spongiiphila]
MMFPLEQDARIGVVAPSGVVDPVKLEKGMARLREAGWEVTAETAVGDSLRYLAGGEVARKASLLRMSAAHAGLLVAARGGYGAMRLLADLTPEELLGLPPFMGFSDATALLVRLVGLGVRAVHGPTIQALATACPETLAALDGLLRSGIRPDPLGSAWETLVDGEGEGVLSGGNLTTLAHLCGTPFQPDFSGCVLALEDLNEAPYRLDRALTQMRLSGALDGVAGVLVGECLHCGEEGELEAVFREVLAPLNIPVVTGGRFGHGPTNLPLVFGEPVVLSSAAGFRYE